MEYKVFIDDNINQNKIKLINHYWIYNDGVFNYENNDISTEFKLDISEIIRIVKENSYCEIKLEKCLNCKNEKKYKVKTRVNFEYIINCFNKFCNDCNKYKVLINETDKLSNHYYDSDYAINNKLWEELLPIELEVLKGIIKYKRKDLIYRFVFNNNTYDLTIWNIINHLEFLGLISLIRDESGKILQFYFSENLENMVDKF